MLPKRYLQIFAIAVASLLIFGCSGKKTSQENFSGFLKDYSKLEETKDTKGVTILRYVSPRLNAEEYNRIILDPVQYYPDPQPSENVSQETLNDILRYVDDTLAKEIAKKFEVVTEPGPNTLRLRIALTAIGQGAENLKPYQFVPVALVLTGVRAAAGGHPERAEIFLEAESTDSITGERLGIAVRSGTGEKINKLRTSSETVTLDSLKPLLNTWVEAYIEFLYSGS